MSITIGLTGRADTVVTNQNTASAVGSGLVPVFATPYMIALMENAAVNALLPHLAADEGSVGTHLNVAHSAATPVGMQVCFTCRLEEIDRRRLVFTVQASDEAGLIGTGTHERFIIAEEKFMAKTESKKQ